MVHSPNSPLLTGKCQSKPSFLSQENSKMSQEANKCPKKINGLEKLDMKIPTIHRDMEELKHLIEYVGPTKAGYWKLLK